VLAIRRLYLYLMSGIGLAVTAAGATSLLGLALGRLLPGRGSVIQGTGADLRDQLSLALALIAVAGPIWLVHWLFVDRSVRRASPGAEAERTAALRAFYLATVQFSALTFAILRGSSAVAVAIRQVLGQPEEYGDSLPDALAMTLVAGAIWAYHVRVRTVDERGGIVRAAAAWWPRLARYGLASIAGLLLLAGAMTLLDTFLSALVARAGDIAGQDWWIGPVAQGTAQVLVGGGAWAWLWVESGRLLAGVDWRAPGERTSAIRRWYVLLALAGGAGATLLYDGSGITAVLAWLGGIRTFPDATAFVRDTIGPVLVVLPFTIAWWYARRTSLAEAGRYGGPAEPPAAERRNNLAAAAVGLAFAGVGAAWVLGFVLDVVLGGNRAIIAGREAWGGELTRYAGFALAGTPLWLWHWLRAMDRQAHDVAGENVATERRAYFYLVLTGGVTSSLMALALIVYRLIGILLGAQIPLNVISDLSTPLGVVLVTGGVVAYHGLLLRSDLGQEAAAAPVATTAAGAVAVGEPPAAGQAGPGTGELWLVVRGSGLLDAATVLDRVRAALPDRYEVRLEHPAGSGGPASGPTSDAGR
jgi:hypothetical protein